MQKYGMRQWRVQGTIITALHIGNGETLDPFLAYTIMKSCSNLTTHKHFAMVTTQLEGELRIIFPRQSLPKIKADQIRELLRKLPWRRFILREFELSNRL